MRERASETTINIKRKTISSEDVESAVHFHARNGPNHNPRRTSSGPIRLAISEVGVCQFKENKNRFITGKKWNTKNVRDTKKRKKETQHIEEWS
jgi:hypothetical protein